MHVPNRYWAVEQSGSKVSGAKDPETCRPIRAMEVCEFFTKMAPPKAKPVPQSDGISGVESKTSGNEKKD